MSLRRGQTRSDRIEDPSDHDLQGSAFTKASDRREPLAPDVGVEIHFVTTMFD
jgi:hypothetical protein